MSDFQSTRLDNGLEIIAERMPGVQSAAIAFFIGHGAVDDSPEQAGLAHLTESAMFRGTASRSSREVNEQLDRIGARHSSSTGLEVTLFNGLLLGNHLDPALEIFVDVLRSAAFPPDEVEAVRALQLQEIGQRNDQPAHGRLISQAPPRDGRERARPFTVASKPACPRRRRSPTTKARN